MVVLTGLFEILKAYMRKSVIFLLIFPFAYFFFMFVVLLSLFLLYIPYFQFRVYCCCFIVGDWKYSINQNFQIHFILVMISLDDERTKGMILAEYLHHPYSSNHWLFYFDFISFSFR